MPFSTLAILKLGSRLPDFSATFRASASGEPGIFTFYELLIWCRSVEPVSVSRLPNVLNLYLKPHFMASVLADLGLIPSNWAEHI